MNVWHCGNINTLYNVLSPECVKIIRFAPEISADDALKRSSRSGAMLYGTRDLQDLLKRHVMSIESCEESINVTGECKRVKWDDYIVIPTGNDNEVNVYRFDFYYKAAKKRDCFTIVDINGNEVDGEGTKVDFDSLTVHEDILKFYSKIKELNEELFN